MKKIAILILLAMVSCKKKDEVTPTTPNGSFIYPRYYKVSGSLVASDTLYFNNNTVTQLVKISNGNFGNSPYTITNGIIDIPIRFDVTGTKYIHTYNSGIPNAIHGDSLTLSLSIFHTAGAVIWSEYGIVYKKF